MSLARVLACVLVSTTAAVALAGCGSSSSTGSSTAGNRPAPSIERTSFVRLPGRPGGRMGVEVVARYHGTGSRSPRRLGAYADARLKDGSTLRAAPLPDARLTTTGRDDRSVPHHLTFSAADSARLQADINGGDKPQLKARVTDVIPGSALAVASVSTPKVESPQQMAKRNERQTAKTPQKLGETYGPPGSSNACDDYGDSCQNVQGWSWTANDFMASHTQSMGDCPSGTQYVEDGENNVWASVDTSDSHHFSGISLGTSITVTDWNTSGHPYHYTIYYACAPPAKKKSP